jgi:phosphoenolpyruvate carboxykinase (GTP)
MLPGETILGDDIAYIRPSGKEARAVNVEAGIFGIIKDIKEKDDPQIHNVLNTPGEVIFSHVFVKDGKPYWLGMGEDHPEEGMNFSGKWFKGKKSSSGEEIPSAHKNARYAVSLRVLENCDSELHNPEGVILSGIMYGGRDSKAYVPVQQSFDWEHGIIGRSIARDGDHFATVGKEGVMEINMMSIQDFISIPYGAEHKEQSRF